MNTYDIVLTILLAALLAVCFWVFFIIPDMMIR